VIAKFGAPRVGTFSFPSLPLEARRGEARHPRCPSTTPYPSAGLSLLFSCSLFSLLVSIFWLWSSNNPKKQKQPKTKTLAWEAYPVAGRAWEGHPPSIRMPSRRDTHLKNPNHHTKYSKGCPRACTTQVGWAGLGWAGLSNRATEMDNVNTKQLRRGDTKQEVGCPFTDHSKHPQTTNERQVS
jgi:hypothetical protein